ncbi:hypothetical protein TrRE_jg3827 [Triparma retinervis]|uniref:Uncharacterized protein n=1 Tax=Triparma retinervis TaxID=2557542 RepID=A0A9W7ADD0_9STRA|nr:hypothetical protein TrRE_jg3827 [Triparma retinervis]
MGDCVCLHSYSRSTSGPTFSCRLALAHSAGALLILSLAAVVGADWACEAVGVVLPPAGADAAKEYRFGFAAGGSSILAVSQVIGDPLSTSLYDVSSFSSVAAPSVSECFAPTSSAVLMSGGIGRGKRWCLAGGGDFLAAVVGGEGDFEEELQMTTLHRSVQGVKVEHDSKRRKSSPPSSPSHFSSLPKVHEFEITSMCISGCDSLIATGDSFGAVYVHGSVS